MLKDRLHLVPQVLLDVAEKLATADSNALRMNYRDRLEATRDYCDAILKADRHDEKQRTKGRR